MVSNKNNILAALTISFALAITLFVSVPVYSQVTGATLTGTVTDTSGAVIPNAQISIKNEATGVTRIVTTDSAGLYSAPNLVPGHYQTTISASDFETVVNTGITLTVGAELVVNSILKLGQVTQKVEVTGAAPAVELATSSVSGLVTSDTVVELPLNGRDWTLLASLQPGVNIVPTQAILSGSNGARVSRGVGTQMAISGTRPQLNNYRLDGLSVVDFSGGGPGSVLGITLGVDAVGEFSVLTANYSAEYGRTSGGVINAITRSGTNEFHGDAFWFLRDEGLDARNFFDTTSRPPFHRNNFGATLGGPIQKEKTFFFFNYEGFRQALGITNVDNVPSQDARNGIIHNANGTTTTVAVDPSVQRYLAFWPLPNAGLIGIGNTGHYNVAVNNAGNENFWTTRIDHKFSDKDSISGTWVRDAGSNTSPEKLDNVLVGNLSNRQDLVLEETHVFNPALVNSLRGGYSGVHEDASQPLAAINPLAADVSLGSFAGRTAPIIVVPGLTSFNGGLGGLVNSHEHWNSFQAYDDAFLIKGAHSLKFGFAFERMQHNVLIPNHPNGQFTFGSLSGFLQNQPVTFLGQLPTSGGEIGARQNLFGGYFQDDWRLRSNLTLNLGIRYEMVTVPTEVHNRLDNLRTITSPTTFLGSPYFNNPTLRNFEPRVGFSWAPFHNSKTAVRGAFGIFDALPLNYEFFQAESQTAPFVEVLTLAGLPAGSFPTGAVSIGGVNPPSSSLQAQLIENDPHRNYVMIWNLNVEQEITPNTSLSVGYVGNHGVHMLNRADDVNLVMPTLTPSGYLWPSPIGSGTRVNPNVGKIYGEFWDGTALYDALEVRLSKKLSHGFQVQGSYTWGKGIDTGSASVIGDPFSNSITSLLQFCGGCRRGLSDFNIAHTLTANYIWDVPAPKNWGGFASHVLGGWELGGIFTAESGVPFTPVIGGDPLGEKSTDPFAYPNRLTGPGCGSPVNPGNPNNYIKLNCFTLPTAPAALAAQCVPFASASGVPIAGTCANLLGNAGRNSIVGPGLMDFDVSLFKNNYIKKISEAFNVQFRAEFFNVFNRANFAVPVDNQTLFDSHGNPVAGAGAIDQTSTPSREIQLALKVIW
jgi:hypothetical protein